MKKLLCLIDSLGPGGAQRQIVGLASLLKERNYNVMVAVYHDDGFYVNQLNADDIPYVCLKNASNAFLRLWKIARFIRHVKPDVVVSYLETPSICACIARLFNRKFKLIVSERNTTQHTGINEIIRFNLFRVADYVVPNAFAQANYINNSFPALASKLVVIPNFVELQHFIPPVKRKRNDIPEIIVVATIWASKNTLGFIDAVAHLRQSGRLFHVSWYGKDSTQLEYFNKCQQKIGQMDVMDCIELMDKTTNILEKYQKADYFCLPSFYEGTPNVICEAMACGLPVACSNICDNSLYVEEGVNGVLFNPNDMVSISKALERLLALSPCDYNDYCQSSRKRAEQKLSKKVFIQSYLNLINS